MQDLEKSTLKKMLIFCCFKKNLGLDNKLSKIWM